MDPRYKLKWFQTSWRAEYYNAAKQKTTNVWNKYKRSALEDTGNQYQDPSTTEMDEISSIVAEKLKTHYKPDDELNRYLSEPLVPMSAGVEGALQWWRVRIYTFINFQK